MWSTVYMLLNLNSLHIMNISNRDNAFTGIYINKKTVSSQSVVLCSKTKWCWKLLYKNKRNCWWDICFSRCCWNIFCCLFGLQTAFKSVLYFVYLKQHKLFTKHSYNYILRYKDIVKEIIIHVLTLKWFVFIKFLWKTGIKNSEFYLGNQKTPLNLTLLRTPTAEPTFRVARWASPTVTTLLRVSDSLTFCGHVL